MTEHILILSIPGDLHAFAVAAALQRKGVRASIWLTSDYPNRAVESILISQRGTSLEPCDINGAPIETTVDCVWNRRPRHKPPDDLVHPADRQFARMQCADFRMGFLSTLSLEAERRGALCVNPWESCRKTENKIIQQHYATQAGFQIPETLYTNDPGRIRSFLRSSDSGIVYKPLEGVLWADEATEWGYYTRTLRETDLSDDQALIAAPGIYQKHVSKEYEIRLTMIGNRPFAAKILSQEIEEARIDWRRASIGSALRFEATELPPDLVRKCQQLMAALGIVFGCFDFIVTPNSEYYFLEVNQAGQFLFLEETAGLPVLDAFSEFLLQGRLDFEQDIDRPVVRLDDIVDEVSAIVQQQAEVHQRAPVKRIDETQFPTLPTNVPEPG